MARSRLALIVDAMNAAAPKGAQPYGVQDVQKRLQAVDARLASAAAAAAPVDEDELKAPPAAQKCVRVMPAAGSLRRAELLWPRARTRSAGGKKGKKGKKADEPEVDETEWEKVERPKKKADDAKVPQRARAPRPAGRAAS